MIQFNQEELSDALYGLSSKNKSPQSVLYEMIDEMRDYDPEIVLTGSTINSLSVNAFYWATKTLLGVSFESNFSMVFGDLCHGFVQFCNQNTIHGRITDPRKAFIFAAKKGRYSYYKRIPAKARLSSAKDHKSFNKIYKEAKPLCQLFYDTIHPTLKPIACENRLKYLLADETGTPLNIMLSGQYDFIEVDTVSDLKTSKFNITGELVEDRVLDKLEADLKELQKKPTKDDHEKQLEQNVKDASKKSPKSELQEVLENQIKASNKILNAKRPTDEEKAEAQSIIDSCQSQLNDEIQRIEKEYLINIQNAQLALDAYITSKEIERIRQIDEIESIVAPLREQINQLQYHNDCMEAKKKHGKQLAFYALLELLINGRNISKGRVILMVRTKIPKIREFVFDIQDELNELIGELDDIIGLINLWRSGVSARFLFRPNRDTYIGSELMDLIDAVKINVDENLNEQRIVA